MLLNCPASAATNLERDFRTSRSRSEQRGMPMDAAGKVSGGSRTFSPSRLVYPATALAAPFPHLRRAHRPPTRVYALSCSSGRTFGECPGLGLAILVAVSAPIARQGPGVWPIPCPDPGRSAPVPHLAPYNCTLGARFPSPFLRDKCRSPRPVTLPGINRRRNGSSPGTNPPPSRSRFRA